MAERPRSRKDDTSPRTGYPRRTRSTDPQSEKPSPLMSIASASPEAADLTLEQAKERIAELDADLAAARTTIRALLDKAEKRAAGTASGVAQSGLAPLPSSPDGRADMPALPEGAGNLDQIVRHWTRALAESEAQLRQKNAELERLNDMRVEFVSIATHELRTPLTSIVGYLELVTEGRFGQLPKPMERPMTSLRRNAHRLMHLVDEMLDVSRIDSGRITLYRQRCDLGDIVMRAVAEVEPTAATKELELSTGIDSPPPIDADAEKIHQVVSKLLANALRHTPERGSISVIVDAAPAPAQSEPTWARLRVRGTGVGIPNHLRNRIFEPFTDVHTAKHHTSTGPDSAGLGLYIARGLIDMHGGLISVDLEEGSYIEFTVFLPRASSTVPAT